MKSRRRLAWFFTALLFVAMSAGAVLAQDEDLGLPQGAAPGQSQSQTQQDPPGRVARLQYSSGQVSMQPGGVNDWIAASLNRPLTTSDRVWTDKDSRAELNLGDGFARMSSETSVTLTNVSDNTVQIELDQGVLTLSVLHLQHGEIYEVDTPNLAFTVMKSGVYRFDVHPSEDQTWVTVRSGYGEATGKGVAVRVNSGTQTRFTGSNSLQNTAYAAPPRDGFDDWVQVRDKRLENSVSARYVSPGVIGYQDLDAYGTWQNVPTYGNIWVPTSVPAGWAPYRYGHWAWIAPWGWTWVDDAPWGFAPFHYGRWVSWNGGWGWAPGPLGYWNPYYAPALVGWIGGAGFGVGFGWGAGWGIGIGFGWFPLGWGAPYYPHYCGWGHGGWYQHGGYVSAGYLHNVNVTNTHITNINNITNNYYNNNLAGVNGNRNVPGAVTAAPKSAFTSGAAINKVGVTVPRANVGQGNLMHTADVSPTRESVLGGNSPARSTPPASAFNRNVVTHNTPPAGPPRFEGNAAPTARANGAPTQNHNAVTAGSPNASPTANGQQHTVARPPNSGANQVANATAPSNPAAHTVHRPPANTGTSVRGGNDVNGQATATNPQHNNAGNSTAANNSNVPRPPASTGTSVRGGSNVNSETAATNPQHNNAGNSPAATNSNVPRPPANYSNHPQNGTAATGQPSHAPAAVPREAPAPHNSAPASREPSGKSEPKGTGTASSAPRPPASYTYHAASAYSASGGYGASRGSNGYSASPAYGSARGSSANVGYSAGRTYGSTPVYVSRNSAAAPRYSAPAPQHYSGGGGGAYHASGGGGGSRASGGGGSGSHASGGGGGHRG